ncbi:ribosome biogenesis factor YjgA [Gilvimarinus algae]|uniref:Dual-action ribosomal maturation protein DarP n=1 Tax=Gilvimarinus algae TaxID=3058037 RepID=A0ABT8TFL8_9GAMM|nr:ribosome biogenesis factor YjgA [Gilvimarinus sp. SDUM040014]MDO3382848.1 ribosome biogenesis factor YjgA [Gilvimarinus sp. SDUM040014]
MNDYYDDEEHLGPSKTQRKREMHALQELGRQLTELKESQLASIELPEEVLTAVREMQRIRQNEAKRRHLQFIGKLMRNVDGERVAADIDAIKSAGTLSVQRQHLIEQWRDRLLSDNDALSEFISQYPEVDIQHLRQLVRLAQKEQSQQKAPAHARKLFRYLRDTLAARD